MTSEAELLQRLPPSNQPGALRRDLLPPGERVWFETRPSLVTMYWGRLALLGVYLLFIGAFSVSSPSNLAGGIFLASPAVLWLVLIYLRWNHRVYALTDRRVIRIGGLTGNNFRDASFAQIQNLAPVPNGLKFDTWLPPSLSGVLVPSAPRPLRWDGLSDVPRVYSFVQEALAFGIRSYQDQMATLGAIDRLRAGTLNCPYCDGPIEIARLDPANPRCPRCTAPLTLPG